MKIQDGKGTGYEVAVDTQNRMQTFSISEERIADVSSRTGNAFIVATDFIALTTTASYSGLVYIKNTSDLRLFISQLRLCSTASGTVQAQLIANPTTGTLISDANLADQLSANLGSSQVFDGLAYSASGDGKTVTDGTNFTQYINHSPGHSIQDYRGAIVIPKGSAIALQVKPSVALTICAEVQCWFE